MTTTIRIIIVAVALQGLSSCATEPGRELQALFQPSPARSMLHVGLKQYEDGEYAESLKSLQNAIDQGLARRDRVTAHKHAAFIHCSANRTRQCRDEFRKALDADPRMDLEPAEAGHPLWGPVFRSVKGGR